MKKNIHFLRDHKISQYFVRVLNKLDLRGKNEIVCYSSVEGTTFLTDYDRIVNPRTASNSDFIAQVDSYEEIYIHLLDRKLIDWLARDTRITSFQWLVWGADIYNMPFTGISLFLPKTRKFVNRFYRESLRALFYRLLIKKKFIAATRKASCVHTWMEEEYRFIQSILEHKIEHKHFTYGTVFGSIVYNKSFTLNPKEPTKRQIMLGHSSVAVGNHLDFLEQQEEFLTSKDITVVIPTSYGHKNYTKFLQTSVSSSSVRVKYVEEYLPIDRYSELLSSMSALIINSIRPLGVGNIMLAFYAGVPVFLPEKNILLPTLRNMGFLVHTTNEFPIVDLAYLRHSEWAQNQRALRESFSMDEIEKKYLEYFS